MSALTLPLRAAADDLRAKVDGEVRFDPGTRAAYSTDASNFRQVPLGVVVPRTVEAAAVAVDVCREHDLPVVSRGGGTSLAGPVHQRRQRRPRGLQARSLPGPSSCWSPFPSCNGVGSTPLVGVRPAHPADGCCALGGAPCSGSVAS